MKSKQILVCEECENPMKQAKTLEDLPCLPSEWYKDKNLFKKFDIFYCSNCNRIYRRSKEFEFMLGQIWEFLKQFDIRNE